MCIIFNIYMLQLSLYNGCFRLNIDEFSLWDKEDIVDFNIIRNITHLCQIDRYPAA